MVIVVVGVINVVVRLIQKEVQNVMTFITTPTEGVFETIDKMVIDLRTGVRDIINEIRKKVR